jgi:hypothetical protein
LAHGERKSIATDRVILVPGPASEIEEVREMFRKFIIDGMSLKNIAHDLNRRGVPSVKNRQWTHSVVASVLFHPKYVGSNVFNRTTMRLGTAPVAVPTSDWVICLGAHEAIVDTQTFSLAQEIRAGQTVHKTDERLLQELRALLAAKGMVSNKLINEKVGMASARTYGFRFGGLRRACELIGHDWRKNGRKSDEEMLQHLRSLLATHGRLSMPIINAAPRLISSHKFRWRFGRLDRAYQLIGYDWKKDLSKAKRRT